MDVPDLQRDSAYRVAANSRTYDNVMNEITNTDPGCEGIEWGAHTRRLSIALAESEHERVMDLTGALAIEQERANMWRGAALVGWVSCAATVMFFTFYLWLGAA